MADTLLWKYGSFTHLPGEVVDARYSLQRHLTKRGMRDRVTVRTKLIVEPVGCGWAAIKAREQAIYDAYYRNPGQRLVLVYPDGSEAYVRMDNTYANGIVVPPVPSITYPMHTNEENVNKRHMEIDIESVQLDIESEILEYKQTIKHTGIAGGVFVWQPTLSGLIQYQLWPNTMQLIVQEGHCTGLEGYPLLYMAPVLPLSQELWWMREFEPHSPETFPFAYYDYSVRWKYTFYSPVPVTMFPAFPP